MSKGRILYKETSNSFLIKMEGDIKYTDVLGFDKLVDDLTNNENHPNIVIDLSEANNIDSTNLGELARIARYTKNHFKTRPIIINTGKDLKYILRKMGFSQAFLILDREIDSETELKELQQENVSNKELAKIILNSHQELSKLNDENKDRFSDVIELMKKEIK